MKSHPALPTLIVSAVTSEIEPLVKRLRLPRAANASPILYRSDSVIVAVTGVGAARAEAALHALRAEQPFARAWLVGFAGALDPSLQVGDLLEPAEILRESTGGTFTPTDPHQPLGRLLTCDAIAATAVAKAALRQRTHADAVDMESAAMAAWCDEHHLPWSCMRVISDTADEALPPFADQLTHADGRPNVAAAVTNLLRKPTALPSLLRLGRSASLAGQRLARALQHRLASLPPV